MAVLRCLTEKRQGFDLKAKGLLNELADVLKIRDISYIRIFSLYDIEGITDDVYKTAKSLILAEPQCDVCYDEALPEFNEEHRVLAVEPIPGQFDQRADSCAQCIQLITKEDRPTVLSKTVYVFFGQVSDEDFVKIQSYLINPVDSRSAILQKPDTIKFKAVVPTKVSAIDGFVGMDDAKLLDLRKTLSLAMDLDDLLVLHNYFKNIEKRDPTITEIRVIDTYWSDHCRHTTFSTFIDNISIEDPLVSDAYNDYLDARREIYGKDNEHKRPVTLMDIATIGAKYLKHKGYLKNLDESEETNACSIKVNATVDGRTETYILMFKNETHNHPTEIEPFGGAATCLGGAIRDPLSGRSYVYQAMRVTGAGDPTVPVSQTLPSKLSQRKICTTAANGYSSYGNQIGIATGLVHEFYHPNYVAKRLEIGAVVGAVPYKSVVRLNPEKGDVVILLGGATGRDGCGGATGSSKPHTDESLLECGSEVQKGNAPEERKIQRLFRSPQVTTLIKRCNDFGAGGVSVAIGELADGLIIDLDKIPKKYEGLDGTELAISESQERMAVVVAKENEDKFIRFANDENLNAVCVATVTDDKRLRMLWNGEMIVDVSREFLNTNGAAKHTDVEILKTPLPNMVMDGSEKDMRERVLHHAASLNICMHKGLCEQFDSTVGASTVIMPFGGKTQNTPSQVMAATLPSVSGKCSTASVMAFGFDPYVMSQNQFLGASFAVIESISKLVAAGCSYQKSYLTFQEYFQRLNKESIAFGKPVAALLGAFHAQKQLKIAAIGGKDSMSGTFNDINVPETFVSFAIAPQEAQNLITPEFKEEGNYIYCFDAAINNNLTPDYSQIISMWTAISRLIGDGTAVSAWALTGGGVIEALMKMSLGNEIGVKVDASFSKDGLFIKNYGGIIVECKREIPGAILVGRTVKNKDITIDDVCISLNEIRDALNSKLRNIYKIDAPCKEDESFTTVLYNKRYDGTPKIKFAKPTAVIPVFPGTNCEYDTAKALKEAGAEAEIVVIKNLSANALLASVEQLKSAIKRSQMIVIPGGFSGGDEPDGSGKFIASFLSNPDILESIHDLLDNRDGLILGICNGFQALIKLGLVPYGRICTLTRDDPTLTFNLIGRHQSKYVETRVSSVKSPWLSECNTGDVHSIAISHGEGRFSAPQTKIDELIANGQVAFQYVDFSGSASMDIEFNPNGSMCAIEGITSPDGRVLGKMGHSERYSPYMAKNIYGEKCQPLFEGGVKYFK